MMVRMEGKRARSGEAFGHRQVSRPALEDRGSGDGAPERAAHALPRDRRSGMEDDPGFEARDHVCRRPHVEKDRIAREDPFDGFAIGLLDPIREHRGCLGLRAEFRQKRAKLLIAARRRRPVHLDDGNVVVAEIAGEPFEPDVYHPKRRLEQLVDVHRSTLRSRDRRLKTSGVGAERIVLQGGCANKQARGGGAVSACRRPAQTIRSARRRVYQSKGITGRWRIRLRLFDELDPPPRLMMGPGPINADPRVLRAMSMPLLGQFDPAFTSYMDEVMRLLRQLFRTENRWAFLVDGTARAGIEAILTSLIEPGDKVLVPVFGRFRASLVRDRGALGGVARDHRDRMGHGVRRGANRGRDPRTPPQAGCCGARRHLDHHGPAARRNRPALPPVRLASVRGRDGDHRRHGRGGGTRGCLDAVSVGLQKCLSGPPGCAPITFNARVEEAVLRRKRIERGLAPGDAAPANAAPIQSNYFDLPMLMDYWSEDRLNHHTEATSMLYAARECVRIALREGLSGRIARHELASRALTAGLGAMDLGLFGDQDHKMANADRRRDPGRR